MELQLLLIICTVTFIQPQDVGFYLPNPEKCLAIAIEKIFKPDATLYFIFGKSGGEIVPKDLVNPYITIDISKRVQRSVNYARNVIIQTEGFQTLNDTLRRLKRSVIWHKEDSSKGTFLITIRTNDFSEVFQICWKHNITKVLVLTRSYASPRLYTSDPYSNENNCAKHVKKYTIQNCNKATNVKLRVNLRNMEKCNAKPTVKGTSAFKSEITETTYFGGFLEKASTFIGDRMHYIILVGFSASTLICFYTMNSLMRY
ncbi:hypothetical protein PPYR_04226 [Photinus pyralis]|uniref:Uncharacterized protein n=2 Tax=Photinus pyralis TaxID=7054 RepID=A0A5N4AXZ2_PHOPY|nr:hypothetical protein PPYR_04226 [Photinus pyralis]